MPFVVQKKALRDRPRPGHRAGVHRPEHERALCLGRLQRGGRQGLRGSDRGQRRPAPRHRARRQRPLGPADPRAHPVRARPDHRRLHARRRPPTWRSCCARARCPRRSRSSRSARSGRRSAPTRSARGSISTGRRARWRWSLFMLIYYRLSGLIADLALALNLLLLMAAMAGFHATLTLPGIAGMVLTIGMAVDTNVLIFERIREELRGGKTVRAAIDAGFARAFRTIVDTHVTVLVSAAILYQFGTGPVKGFAVSLAIGLLASLFTAVFFTRLIFDLIYMGSRRVRADLHLEERDVPDLRQRATSTSWQAAVVLHRLARRGRPGDSCRSCCHGGLQLRHRLHRRDPGPGPLRQAGQRGRGPPGARRAQPGQRGHPAVRRHRRST